MRQKYQQNIKSLHQIESNSQDIVFSAWALHYIDNLEKCFKEVYRVLKNQGKCLVYVPFLYPYHGGSNCKDYFRYSKDGIEYLFGRRESLS